MGIWNNTEFEWAIADFDLITPHGDLELLIHQSRTKVLLSHNPSWGFGTPCHTVVWQRNEPLRLVRMGECPEKGTSKVGG